MNKFVKLYIGLLLLASTVYGKNISDWSFFGYNFDMSTQELKENGFSCYSAAICQSPFGADNVSFDEVEMMKVHLNNDKITSFEIIFRPKDQDKLVKALKQKYSNKDVELEFWQVSSYRFGMEAKLKSRIKKVDYSNQLK